MTDCIPKEIVKAICAVQTGLSAVKKSAYNKHGGYHFASTDDIYASITHTMGKVGLALISLEDNCEIKRFEQDAIDKAGNAYKRTVQWAHLEFSFVLAAEDGSTWTDKRLKRTLYIQVTGPQTFQAAQSYAEKAFLRSLFKIPTGDMDLDSAPQADSIEAQEALTQPRKRMSSAAAKKDGKTSPKFDEIKKTIAEAINREMLMHVWETYADDLAAMPFPWQKLLSDDYDVKMKEFLAEEASFREAAE